MSVAADLDTIWAAVNDRLLAKGPLSNEYAASVSAATRRVKDNVAAVLMAARDVLYEAADEGWLKYRGTDETRASLSVLANAIRKAEGRS